MKLRKGPGNNVEMPEVRTHIQMSIPPSGYHQSAKGYRFDAA